MFHPISLSHYYLNVYFSCMSLKERMNVTIYISTHPLNRLYLKAIHKMLKIRNVRI